MACAPTVDRWKDRGMNRWIRSRIWLCPVVTVLLFSLALRVLHAELASIQWSDVSAVLVPWGWLNRRPLC
jgi:hypothetical protein